MAEKFPLRSEVEEKYTWDISKIFKNESEFDAELENFELEIKKLEENYKGRIKEIKDTNKIMQLFKELKKISNIASRLFNYLSLSYATEMTNPEIQAFYGSNSLKLQKLASRLSFALTEMKQIDNAVLDEFKAEFPVYETFVENLKEQKKHQLSDEAEQLLADLHPVFDSFYDIYGACKALDIDFEEFEIDGKTYPMSYVLYENVYSGHESAEVRRKAFESFSKGLEAYKNVTAATYTSHVKQEIMMAEIRGYEDVFEYLLADQNVTKEMYNRQIDVIMSELPAVMRKYAKVLKRALGLDKLYFADLKAQIDPSFEPKISIEESIDYIEKAVSLAGPDYRDMIMRFYDERWVDFPQNVGKETGGFCTIVHEVQPYILLNWTGDLAETFTLCHELGHAGEMLLIDKYAEPMLDSHSMYLSEAPSTFHELLLGESMLKESTDDRFKRLVLTSLVSKTYYHNFITHLHEAAWQREVYKRMSAGESLNADDLSAIFRKVLEDFWGDEVIIEEGAELTWMRQPHYYMGLYSYTYSAGLTIGTQMLLRIRKEGEAAIKDWLGFLKAGTRLNPLEKTAEAGIDISTDKALKETIQYIDSLVDEIDRLTPGRVE